MKNKDLIDIFREHALEKERSLTEKEVLAVEAVNCFLSYLNDQEGISVSVKGRRSSLGEVKLNFEISGETDRYEYSLYIPNEKEVEYVEEVSEIFRSKSFREMLGLKKNNKLLEAPENSAKFLLAYADSQSYVDSVIDNKTKTKGYNLFNEEDQRSLAEKIMKSIAQKKVDIDHEKLFSSAFRQHRPEQS